MTTLLRKCRRAKSAAFVAIFLAAIASATAVHGAITLVKSWGTQGSASGQFDRPAGVAVSPTGQVYVTDSNNNRVQQFDNNGGFQLAFGSSGSGAGQFLYPAGVAFSPTGQVYVVDTGNHRVERFDSNGVYQTYFGSYGGGNGQFISPAGVAAGPTGQVYVSDQNRGDVQRFSGNGVYQIEIGYGSLAGPFGVAVSGSGQVFVADRGNARIQRFDSNGGSQFIFGSGGNGIGQFSYPDGVAVSATGLVYVADTSNNRIQRFDGNGVYQTSFGSLGSGSGQFNLPQGVAVSPTGEIFVADTSNYRIVKYFDPAEWVSGSPYLDSAALGPGQILGTTLNLDPARGLNIVGGLSLNAGSTLTQSGTISAGSLTNSGQYTINGTNLTLTSGSLTNNTSLTITNGGMVVGSVFNNYGATLSANAAAVTGDLVNNGTFTQSGQLVISGSLTNNGLALLNPGGAITTDAAGAFTNTATGILRGDGAVTMTLTNSGGLIHANGTTGLTLSSFVGNYAGGELRVADGDSMTVLAGSNGFWVNSSTITLKGPNAVFNGDTITNYNTISGLGRVANSITNYGTIRAEGGQLVLAGPTIANVGTIQAAAGNSILVSQGLNYNSGLISLTGGSFDNDSVAMTNGNSILGNGTFSTGGLLNAWLMTFSDGNSSIFGTVNNSGGTINTYGTSATNVSFYGLVTSDSASRIKINGNTVRWLGGLVNNGVYISDPADNYFTGLAVGASGLLQGGVGDRFFVTSPFTSAGEIDLGGTSTMIVNNGAGLLTQTAGKLDLGTNATLSAGTVAIDGGTLLADGPAAVITASLVYASSSSSTYQGVLAGPRTTLTVNNPSALLVLSGTSNTYAGGTFVFAGDLIVASPGGILDGTNLIVGSDITVFAAPVPASVAVQVSSVPEPGTLALLTIAVCGAVAYQRLRSRRRQQ